MIIAINDNSYEEAAPTPHGAKRAPMSTCTEGQVPYPPYPILPYPTLPSL